MEEFIQACYKASESILNGSLYEGDDYPNAPQVDKASWKYLAKINELGFLSWVSQDAINWKTGKSNINERPYISGIMPISKARVFIERFNMGNNDKIAEICINIPKQHFREKPDGEYIRGSTNWREDEKKLNGMQVSVVQDGLIESILEINHLPQDLELLLVVVNVIDLYWGRKATSKNGLWKAVIKALK